MLRERIFDTGTVALNYAEMPAEGPPLVLLHGGGDRWQEFRPLLPALGSRWHVYALDLRGHGKSGRVPGSYRPDEYVPDVTTFVERVLDQPAVLFGHSLGGWVALLAAAQLGKRVRALILGDPPLDLGRFVAIEGSEERVKRWRTLQALVRSRLSVTEMASALADLTGGEANDLHEWAETLSQADPDAAAYHATGRIAEYVRHIDLDAALRVLVCRVLLIQADPALGAMIADEDAEHALSLLADGVHIRLDGIGHSLGLGEVEAAPLLRAVTAFLDTLQ